ncbi:MAG TPA: hypothetical protein VE843_09290, partial [Ktedonobacteraceae bacterium]|nr:hypothetical protein [Ktedonobacteraceae bacterium]
SGVYLSVACPTQSRDPAAATVPNGGVRMNTRRHLLLMLALSALFSPRAPLAQKRESNKTYQIGFLTRKKDASVSKQIEAFLQKLHDLGWVEGQNFTIEYRDADGN